MRPVQKGGSHPKYLVPAKFTFSGSAAGPIKRALSLASAIDVPLSDCLDAWLRQVRGDKPLGGTRSDQIEAVQAIRTKVTTSYKRAAVPLTEKLGDFCSFCETPVLGLLEVEHCVPKSEYPTFALEWTNFLLACSPCNTAKANVPSRSTVRGWAKTPITDEQGYYDEIRSRHYVWADVGGRSHRSLPVCLESYDPGGDTWTVLPMDQAAHLDNNIISFDIGKREVRAGIYDPKTNGQVQRIVRARLVPSGASTTRGQEMVNLCALNENGNLASPYDRRVLNRTKAWFLCLASLRNYLAWRGTASQVAAWTFLLQNSASVGFYSNWLTILCSRDARLARQFVKDSNQTLYYPGTDTSNLP